MTTAGESCRLCAAAVPYGLSVHYWGQLSELELISLCPRHLQDMLLGLALGPIVAGDVGLDDPPSVDGTRLDEG